MQVPDAFLLFICFYILLSRVRFSLCLIKHLKREPDIINSSYFNGFVHMIGVAIAYRKFWADMSRYDLENIFCFKIVKKLKLGIKADQETNINIWYDIAMKEKS